MKDLKRLISQRKYLHEKGDLAQRIKGFMLDLDFYFRQEENAKDLVKQYSQSLDPKSNSDLNNEFVRISKKDHVYYGQVND